MEMIDSSPIVYYTSQSCIAGPGQVENWISIYLDS